MRLLLDGASPIASSAPTSGTAPSSGADAPYGDRARLLRELDRLKALGVSNLRIMAAAEEGPLKSSIKPGFRSKDHWNESPAARPRLLPGRAGQSGEMKAVLYLSNFWEWSGGFGS